MNISSISSAITSSATTSTLQPASVTSGSDQDGDGDGGSRVHHGHGGAGGHMLSAVAQALKSLGLALPASDTGNSASSSTGPAAVSTASGASNVKLDLQQFMHQLFEAIKSKSTASPSAGTNASSSGDAQASFAPGLSSLISAVSDGTAPAALQSAFAKLSVDLQPTSATGSSSSSSGSSSQGATLKAFLTNLQQDLGYGRSNSSLSGNLLTAQV